MRLGDRYRLDARLGAGGMGEVWRAVDEVLGRTVAVKAMLPSVADEPDFARRFLAEATAMARVSHPAVASIHDYGHSHDMAYLVMELVDGESLAQRLARVGRLSPAETMAVIAQAADGLQAVHNRGIVHRDVKPANLLIRWDGTVVIIDFGIARRHDASLMTADGAILGTPSYLSPEQVLGQPATELSDVYSLGLTAYECLAGEKPFVADNPYAVALQRLQQAPRTIGITLPAQVLAVVQQSLATDPAYRWQSAAAFAEAARAAAGLGGAVRPMDPGSAQPASGSHYPAPGGAAAPPDSGSRHDRNFGYGSGAGSVIQQAAQPGGVAAGSGGGAKKSSGVRAAIVVAVVAVLVAGVATVWAVNRGGGRNDAQGAGPTAQATLDTGLVRAGLVPCGPAFCPQQPMCWGGMSATNGIAFPPSQVDCVDEHYWETFVVIVLPQGADEIRTDDLMKQPEIASACSAGAMAAKSKDPAVTRTWERDAWPIQLPGKGSWMLHCIARPVGREATAAVFGRTG